MLSKQMMGGGAIFVAVAIAATELLNLPGTLHYLWALLALVWGIIILTQKK
mgnify:FL=1